MVFSKDFAFKVNRQTPVEGPQLQAYGTVIDCRPGVKRRCVRGDREIQSRRVRLARVQEPDDADKAVPQDSKADSRHATPGTGATSHSNSPAPSTVPRAALMRSFNLGTPTKFRKGTILKKSVDLDCWFTILRFSDPGQLLEMRAKIASCYRFLRDNPMLWKHSRTYRYDDTLPDPPSELNEFQYAHLRHGHGCMSCHTPNTRKTYWAFLRRWCRVCLHANTVKEDDVVTLLRGVNEEHYMELLKCLPVGVFDSWENFVGVGPAHTHSLKNIYVARDVENLVEEYRRERAENPATWHAESRAWMGKKETVQRERLEFARKMELWEDHARQSRTSDFAEKKKARKKYFQEKAAALTPPITPEELENCASYRRAIAIPKMPNLLSWSQLKVKVEKEVEIWKASQVACPGLRHLPDPALLVGSSSQHHLPLVAQMPNATFFDPLLNIRHTNT